jgi:hypothetical protein
MGNPFATNEAPRSGPLADAAERLDRVVSMVKDQQRARTNAVEERPKESEVFVLSPEEAWSKKYMIQCVGPVCTIRPTEEGALLLPRFAPAPPLKQAAPSVELAPQKAPEIKAEPAGPSRRAAPEQIGLAIGKPFRKRSLLGRLFRP